MKKLILIRHGEAEPETTKTADFDRDLTFTGKQATAKMAALLLNNVTAPDYIVSSPAIRALNTAHIFAATFGLDQINTDSEIYEANATTLLKIISLINNDRDVVWLVGHNPGISNVLYNLTGEVTTMPTSAWVELDLIAENWTEVSINTATLLQYKFP